MNASEIRQKFQERVPILEEFGEYVVNSIKAALVERTGQKAAEKFFSIEPSYRVKDVEGFIEKTCREGKTYQDPLSEITDQVGARFIVLRFEQVDIVNQIVLGLEGLKRERARDMVEERDLNPHHFDYSSDHWVVWPEQEITIGRTTIPSNMACEVQVRTLLQHAYAELAHSTVYKPNLTADVKVVRAIARGAALIETTDKVFDEVGKMIEDVTRQFQSHLKGADHWCKKHSIEVEHDLDFPLTLRIIDSFSDVLSETEWEQIEEDLDSKPWLPSRLIAEATLPLHNREVIVLVYWLTMKLRENTSNHWPLDLTYLTPVYTALGISVSD